MKKIISLLAFIILVLAAGRAITQQTGEITLSLNKKVFGKQDKITATVTLGVIAPMYAQYIVFVSPETGDIETLKLKNITAKKLSTDGNLKILIGLRPVKNDGSLIVKPGGKIYAYYYKKDLDGAHPNTIIAKSKTEVVSVSADIGKK